jgi:hypothetical protein
VETIQLVTESPSPKPFVIPFSLLILDLFGLAVVGLGIAEQVGKVHFLPELLRFNGAGLVMMLLGVVCMLPLVLRLLKISKLAKQQENEWLKGLPEELQLKLSENIKRELRK